MPSKKSLSKTQGTKRPAQATRTTAGIQDRRELENERFCELVDTFGGEPDTRRLLLAILEAKAAPDVQRAQLLAVSLCLAEVMENPCTPSALYNEIGDTLADIQNEHEGSGGQERELRAGFLVPAMIAASGGNDIPVAKTLPDDRQVQFRSLANRLADLIDDPNVPKAAASLLEQAATGFINDHAGDDRSYVRRRFAVACALATAQERASGPTAQAE
jgi:hypothetical protein